MNMDEFLASRNIKVDPADTKVRQDKMYAEMRAYKLRELRESLGMTQGQVAEKIGVSQRQVSKIERGDISNSKVSTIQGYLGALGASMSVYAGTGELQARII